MQFEIDHLARHERYLPLIAEWQLAEFGYLNPTDMLEGIRTSICFVRSATARRSGSTIVKSRIPQGRSSGGSALTPYFVVSLVFSTCCHHASTSATSRCIMKLSACSGL